MKAYVVAGIIIATFVMLISCDTPLNEYQPKSEDEKQISALLNAFIEARNSGDLTRLQSTFHDDGLYISNQGIRVPKAQIAGTQPEWWIDHGTVRLLNPEIEISNTDAKVRVTEKHGAHFKTPGIYTLRKENGHWLIMKRE